jgi:hypothetical protein
MVSPTGVGRFGHSSMFNLRITVLNLGGCTMKTLVTERWQRNELAEEFRTHAVECQEIAELHCDLIREQYEALARQWLAVARNAGGDSAVSVLRAGAVS